jgi:hypothetical protein
LNPSLEKPFAVLQIGTGAIEAASKCTELGAFPECLETNSSLKFDLTFTISVTPNKNGWEDYVTKPSPTRPVDYQNQSPRQRCYYNALVDFQRLCLNRKKHGDLDELSQPVLEDS